MIQSRLNECRAAALAVREGLCSIIPASVVALLHWKELRALVAGREHINIELLRACTEYDEDVSPGWYLILIYMLALLVLEFLLEHTLNHIATHVLLCLW